MAVNLRRLVLISRAEYELLLVWTRPADVGAR